MRKHLTWLGAIVLVVLLGWAARADGPRRLKEVENMAKINLSISSNPAPNICCSADGKIVYVCSRAAVYRSDNFGEDWTRIVDDE